MTMAGGPPRDYCRSWTQIIWGDTTQISFWVILPNPQWVNFTPKSTSTNCSHFYTPAHASPHHHPGIKPPLTNRLHPPHFTCLHFALLPRDFPPTHHCSTEPFGSIRHTTQLIWMNTLKIYSHTLINTLTMEHATNETNPRSNRIAP